MVISRGTGPLGNKRNNKIDTLLDSSQVNYGRTLGRLELLWSWHLVSMATFRFILTGFDDSSTMERLYARDASTSDPER